MLRDQQHGEGGAEEAEEEAIESSPLSLSSLSLSFVGIVVAFADMVIVLRRLLFPSRFPRGDDVKRTSPRVS
jgi:hypothetical protein